MDKQTTLELQKQVMENYFKKRFRIFFVGKWRFYRPQIKKFVRFSLKRPLKSFHSHAARVLHENFYFFQNRYEPMRSEFLLIAFQDPDMFEFLFLYCQPGISCYVQDPTCSYNFWP